MEKKRCELKDEQADICKYLLLFRNRSEDDSKRRGTEA